MPQKPVFPVRVFYDGSCAVCAAEIEHYLTQDHAARLVAVDISASDFDPGPFQISQQQFMSELHVIDQSGRIYRGVEAFWAIWQAFPADRVYGVLAAVLAMPLINPVARLCYKGFAHIRSYLPKRHRCSDGICVRGKKQ